MTAKEPQPDGALAVGVLCSPLVRDQHPQLGLEANALLAG